MSRPNKRGWYNYSVSYSYFILSKIIMNTELHKNHSRRKDNNELFATYDLGCSAALLTAGFELITLDRANQRKTRFVFYRTKNIEKVADDFWTSKLEVKARTFFDNIKMLKNRIYSE